MEAYAIAKICLIKKLILNVLNMYLTKLMKMLETHGKKI